MEKFAKLYNHNEYKKIKNAAKLVRRTLNMIGKYVKEGVSTEYLNNICHKYIISNNGYPAPPTKGFPKEVCISVNEEVCHGIPSSRILKDGDIVNIDVSLKLDGMYGDSGDMFVVGKCHQRHQNLINVCYNSLMESVKYIKIGQPIELIGEAIEMYINPFNFGIVEDFCGHGIGKDLHESPLIFHCSMESSGYKFHPGMSFTIEPMINLGTGNTLTLEDKWTIITEDREFSAQWERMIFIHPDRIEILT